MESVMSIDDRSLEALEEALRGQTAAAQADDAAHIAHFGERALALLDEIGDGARRLPAAALRRLRDLSAYNQLLLRYAFTSWAATRLDRQRSANSYDAQGRLRDSSRARTRAMGPRGVL